MLVEGDVTCLHCGFESGQWRGPKGNKPSWEGFRAVAGKKPGDQDLQVPLRCLRCQGPVMLTNIQPLVTAQRLRRIQRMRDELAELEARAARRAKRRAAAA